MYLHGDPHPLQLRHELMVELRDTSRSQIQLLLQAVRNQNADHVINKIEVHLERPPRQGIGRLVSPREVR